HVPVAPTPVTISLLSFTSSRPAPVTETAGVTITRVPRAASCSSPPLTFTADEVLRSPWRSNVPALTLVAPLKVLLPARVIVPAPDLLSAKAPSKLEVTVRAAGFEMLNVPLPERVTDP